MYLRYYNYKEVRGNALNHQLIFFLRKTVKAFERYGIVTSTIFFLFHSKAVYNRKCHTV